MKQKNQLVSSINIDEIKIILVCRKLSNGKYHWYGNDGSGRYCNMGIPTSRTLNDAKSALQVTYPPCRYNLKLECK